MVKATDLKKKDEKMPPTSKVVARLKRERSRLSFMEN